MNLVHKIEDWGDHHHPKVLDLIRVALGIFLFLKGAAFLENMPDLEYTITSQDVVHMSSGVLLSIVYLVVIVHMIGGALITLGVYTRFSSLVQIPIVFGAVFFVDVFKSPLNTQLIYAVTALIMLVIFTIIGSGPLSLDSFLKNSELE